MNDAHNARYHAAHPLHPSPLFDFRLQYDKDRAAWWRLMPLEAKTLFDEALAHIEALQDRIDTLPDETPCRACGAIACACAYDWPGAVCGLHSGPTKDGEVVLPDGCVGGHHPDLVSCEIGADWP